ATCGADLGKTECDLLLRDQKNALALVNRADKALARLQNERAEIARGERKKMSCAALQTEKKLNSLLGSASDSDVQGLRSGIAGQRDFLSDASGKYSYRMPNANDVALLNGRDAAMMSTKLRPNEVAVFPSYVSEKSDRVRHYYMVHDGGHPGGLSFQPEVY